MRKPEKHEHPGRDLVTAFPVAERDAAPLAFLARAGLTEAQDDGRACVRCGLEGLPMLPTGKRGSHGAQLFECERHGRKAAP